jgi:Fe(II)/alpha-ketoglutarate-dependent arginine beta-hydroxylase
MISAAVSPDVVGYVLPPADQIHVDHLLTELVDAGVRAHDPAFLAEAGAVAHHLPAPLVTFLRHFRAAEPASVATVTGLRVDDHRIGPTPGHWRDHRDPTRTQQEDLYLVLLSSLMGEVFGWDTLQEGAMLHSLLPSRGAEHTQSGQGSRAPLDWHIEDAFHPYRCDYLALMGLRNPHRVATTFASVRTLSTLSAADRAVLFEPRFVIRPDGEHLRGAAGRPALHRSGAPAVEDYQDDPPPVAVLWGDPAEPYLRINPPFMQAQPGDTEAAAVLSRAIALIEAAIEDLPVGPGDIVIIDNYRAVHGRRPFVPRYDGTDRWLRKTTITRDLRRSRAVRSDVLARTIR